jgi:Secretion system C-terminal sorting domain
MVFHWSNSATGLVTTHFVKDDGQANYTFSSDIEVDPAGLWPGFAVNGNTIFLTDTPDPARIPGNSFYSTDYGATWTQSSFPTPPNPAAIDFENPESWPEFNPANSSEIGFAMLQEEEPTPGGENYQGGVAWTSTTDLGATWNSMTVYDFGTILPGNFAYLPQTYFQYTFYTQIMNAYSDNGTGHLVFNGNGFQVSGADTFSIYPIVYWNTQQQQLIELTADSVARNPAIADTVFALFPYRCVGNSWPSIATGPDGVVAVVWQQIEMVDSLNVRVVYGTLGATQVPFYATDIFCAVSSDYGQTWSDPFKVGGEIGECDMYPILARTVEKDANNNYLMHLIYLWDTNPGGSLASPSETDFSECAWIYNLVDITSHVPVGINPTSETPARDFKLAQNYPNPFNPSTTINFNLPRPTEVTLEVFNNLGQKVATLVNSRLNAGDHEVKFEGKNLSSGIYFYRLTADNMSQKRKMVLMK